MRIGYEVFYAKPGTVSEQQCRVCSAFCDANRNVYGPMSFAAAVGKKFDHSDVFVCPNAGEAWHEQALKLVLSIEETPSKRVAELMQLDLDELLAEHGVK